ncbi:Fanconi anemia group A protein [Polypterus senegalus]|nr:Fanconi anemia group A protein [Polypterus senegalus]
MRMSGDLSFLSGTCSQSVASQKRSFSALLAERSLKRKPVPENEKELQEAAVHLFNRHQNLGDLLVEENPVPYKKTYLDEENKSGKSRFSAKITNGDSLLVSALYDLASTYGIPVGVLAARKVVEKILELFLTYDESSQSVLLTSEKREILVCLTKSVKELRSQNAFSRQIFCQEMWSAKHSLPLELVWYLHKENITSLEEFLESNRNCVAVSGWLFRNLNLLCGEMNRETDICHCILSDVVTVLVRYSFQEANDKEPSVKLKRIHQVCFTTMNEMLSWVLEVVTNEKVEEKTSKENAAQFWIKVYDVRLYQGAIAAASLRQFFTHSLTYILTYKPQFKVSDAIGMQSKWSFAKTNFLLTSLFRKLFVLFDAEELLAHLQQVLETLEVNWQNVLSCISSLLVCHILAQQKLKELLSRLLKNAFENYDTESLITAFLLVRQASLEGPAVFNSYSDWFKNSFGNASSYHGNCKKSLVFLLKFLSDLVPFEPPQYLKVHVFYPPYVPAKYRSSLLEYITVAKTRLSDLKVSVEDMGLFEDPSAAEAPTQVQCQAEKDVEKAIALFENSGRIPASVMEASIFRRPYYMSKFLPALLTPRLLPNKPDSKVSFIESLRKAEKIPANFYSSYIQSCEKIKQQNNEGAFQEMGIAQLQEPCQLLNTALEELNCLISGQSKLEDITPQISLISNHLRNIIPHNSNESYLNMPLKLDILTPKLEPLENKVTDDILKSFCQNILHASKFGPPDGNECWASVFMKMLCDHRQILQIVLTRLLHLICHQGSSLTGVHILGLSAFVIHFHESKIKVTLVNSGVDCDNLIDFAECLNKLMLCNSEESMTFCSRFCTAALTYGFCVWNFASVEEIKACIPKGFCKKIQYIIPRLYAEVRFGSFEDEITRNIVPPSCGWKKSALALYNYHKLKELVMLPEFKLTFKDWIMAELDVQPGKDFLLDMERQEYQRWICYQQYLSSSFIFGGFAGDLESECSAIINTLVDHSQRSKVPYCNMSNGLEHGTCYSDILCRLQELTLDLELMRTRKMFTDDMHENRHFLFNVIKERLTKLQESQNISSQLIRQQEIEVITRIILTLPPTMLLKHYKDRSKVYLSCEEFWNFVNTEQKNSCFRGCVLQYSLTAHFFRGLVNSSIFCENPHHVVSELLTDCIMACPLLISSAAFWWLKLEPVLQSQWNRVGRGHQAVALGMMTECQAWAKRSLCGEVNRPPSDSPFVLASFLYFSFLKRTDNCSMTAVLGTMCDDNEQVLIFLLFLSLVDLINVHLHPKDNMDLAKVQKCCTDIVKCLEDVGQMLVIFNDSGAEQEINKTMKKMMSDVEIQMLPFAFYSLLLSLDLKVRDCILQHKDFLRTVLRMYIELLKLSFDGCSSESKEEQSYEQINVIELVTTAKKFLLQVISQTPERNIFNRKQLEAICGNHDPEVKAALAFRLQATGNDFLDGPDFV